MKKITMDEEQRRALIADFNTVNFKPKFKNIFLLLESQIKKNPKKIAIEFGEEKITYGELGQKTDVINNFLTCFLKKNQQKIYIFADKGIDTIAAFLGVLKSENILIPLNPKYPPEMIKEIFKEVKPDLVIVQKKYLDVLKQGAKNLLRLPILTIDELIKEQFSPKRKRLRHAAKNIYSYIYFTSGSTGRPKAVLGRASSLIFYVECSRMIRYLNKSRIAHLLSIYAPQSLLRVILPALCWGATLCFPESYSLLFKGSDLVKWLEDNRIAYMNLATSLFKYFVNGIKNKNQLKNLKYIMAAGDKFPNDRYLKNFFDKINPRTKLFNSYGSTELPLGFIYKVSKADLNKNIIPIGKSRGGKAIVLNDKMEVQLPGEIGEIYIRAPYFLPAGYYNNPELTKKVFIKNPFSRNPKDIIYRTGDIGRLLTDGNIEILGRKDNQVKIRRWRVEPEGVEAKILTHPKIKNCAVLAKKDKNGENYLVAYYTARRGLSEKQLIFFLKQRLPDYMLPSYFIRLTKMPLNFNNKIDRLALAAINEKKYGKIY
jgi:amino acid adenylation domain-containing protein